jgi:hypothetical protein
MHTGTRASDECISSLPGFCERETLVEEAVVMSDGLAYPLGPNQADLFGFTCQTRKEKEGRERRKAERLSLKRPPCPPTNTHTAPDQARAPSFFLGLDGHGCLCLFSTQELKC